MKEQTKAKIEDLVDRYPALNFVYKDILESLNIIIECYKSGGKLLVCGNGGSAADAQHIVGELMKSFILPRKISSDLEIQMNNIAGEDCRYLMDNLQGALPAISLQGELALSSAYANDVAPDLSFAQQIFGLGNKNDALLAISTSGHSKNIIYACKVAKLKGMKIVSLTGITGGKLKLQSDVTICAPANETYKIQEYHLPIYHTICLALEEEFFGE